MSINSNKSQNINQLNKEGLDINLVINKNYLNSLGDIYKCSLCQKIMLNPVECELCGHDFCFNCLNSSNCPFGCKTKKINKASLSIYNILNNIKFKCANIGCTESLEYSEVEKHFKECPYQRIKCENEGCDKIILRKDYLHHNKNECEYSKIKCKFCLNEFIKKEIDKHEKECELIYKEKEKLKYDNDNINLQEHLKRLSNNLNEIIKENKKLVEIFNSKNKEENLIPNRISIRKSIVPGLEDDEFFDILKEELDKKIKKYYIAFINNYEKILNEIMDLKLLLNKYIEENKTKFVDKIDNEEIKIYLNNQLKKIENEFKNTLDKYNDEFSKEFTIINNVFEDKAENNNKTQKNKKDMYSLINMMFNNLSKFLFEENGNINNLINEFINQINNLFNSSVVQNKTQNLNAQKNKAHKNKLSEENKDKINKENINNIKEQILIENKKKFLKNTKLDLIELENNMKTTINLINEKFAVFSDLINNNNIFNNFNKSKYKICPIFSFSIKKNLEENNINQISSTELLNEVNNNELISLNNLDTKLTYLENESKKIFTHLKEKINSEIINKLNEINLNIEKDMDEKIDLFFSLKHCKECEKVDYFYGFTQCIICSEDICKQCISLCMKCKNFCCLKCGKCKKCDKIICKKCQIKCVICNEYYCQDCILNCIDCKNNICFNCINPNCSLCNKNNFCLNCGKRCQICEKSFCEKCYKNIEFSQCYLCKKDLCINCFKKCKEHDNIICKNCCGECQNCNNIYCNNEIISCNKCKKNFCIKCGEGFIKNNNCKLCKSIFCQECINNTNFVKCYSCNKKPCFICSSKCEGCSNTFCKECSNLCKNCNKISCNKCSFECICEKYFCLKCASKNEIIYPHECIYFTNNCAITESKKICSLKMVPNNLNIEAKFSVLMNDISDKSFLLVGIIDNNNNYEKNDNEIVENRNIFAVNVNNGNKFSSKKGFESFLDFDDIKKGINYVYIMIKASKLFFKVNESIYKWAYDLDKKNNYWFYVENNIKDSAIKFFFIRKIK